MSLATQNPAATILDNYAAVIEGSASYPGVPGAYSYDSLVKGNLSGLTATAGSTTTATIGSLSAADGAKLVRTRSPAVFLVCLTQGSGSQNIGAARKITAHDGVDTFTVSKAFAAAVANGDTFGLREGFKRLPDNEGIEDASGKARFFSLELLPGRLTQWSGTGYETYVSTLVLKLRLAEKDRGRNEAASLMDNALLIRSYLTRADYRDSLTQLLTANDQQPVVTEANGINIVEDRFDIVYRVDGTIK